MTSSSPAARFDAAIEREASDLLAYLLRRVGDRNDAADALGEVFVTAWRRRADLPAEPQACRRWLFTVAKNVELNQRRGNRRRNALVERLQGALGEAPVAEPGNDEVRAAITALPVDQAELVRLVHWDGFRLVEAAEIQGVSASTARSRYAAARQSLRERLSVHAASGRDAVGR